MTFQSLTAIAWGMVGGLIFAIPMIGIILFKWKRHRVRSREAAAWRRYS